MTANLFVFIELVVISDLITDEKVESVIICVIGAGDA
jgi:hypothetical protein